ncbi:MAG: TetR/AcrR family transcriptional regulator [Lentimicrobiaceae bacterium]|nr:TetR/AcrR family transcriptional regulator [Lentimicrobiaceae bacterium]
MEEKIIEVAKALFIEKGYAETSMSEIAAKAGINRPGLHYYFRTKDKMFEAVFGDILLSIVPKIFDIISQKDMNIERRIEEMIDTYYALFIDNPKLPMFMMREINRDANLLIKTATQLNIHEKFRHSLDTIEQEMKEGKLKQVPIRFMFYNISSLLTIPFLTQDLTYSILLEEGETFEDMLKEWKPYIIKQLLNLIENR